MSVEGLDAGEELGLVSCVRGPVGWGWYLAVVAAGDEDLGVRAGCGLEERERAGGELVLFDEGDLVFTGPLVWPSR